MSNCFSIQFFELWTVEFFPNDVERFRKTPLVLWLTLPFDLWERGQRSKKCTASIHRSKLETRIYRELSWAPRPKNGQRIGGCLQRLHFRFDPRTRQNWNFRYRPNEKLELNAECVRYRKQMRQSCNRFMALQHRTSATGRPNLQAKPRQINQKSIETNRDLSEHQTITLQTPFFYSIKEILYHYIIIV